MPQPEDIPTAEALARRKLFTAALRSGDYPQGRGNLSEISHGQWRHCCLGVACLIAAEHGLDLPSFDDHGRRYYSFSGNPDDEEFTNNVQLPETVAKWYGWGVRDNDPRLTVRAVVNDTEQDFETTAIGTNDDLRKTFPEIADAFDAKYVAPYEPVEAE